MSVPFGSRVSSYRSWVNIPSKQHHQGDGYAQFDRYFGVLVGICMVERGSPIVRLYGLHNNTSTHNQSRGSQLSFKNTLSFLWIFVLLAVRTANGGSSLIRGIYNICRVSPSPHVIPTRFAPPSLYPPQSLKWSVCLFVCVHAKEHTRSRDTRRNHPKKKPLPMRCYTIDLVHLWCGDCKKRVIFWVLKLVLGMLFF